MQTATDIINLGLAALGAQRVSQLSPPRTELERFMASSYPAWRDAELARNRWLFAIKRATLTQTDDAPEIAELPYAYLIPNDCLRPLRDDTGRGKALWVREGKYLYSEESTLVLRYVARVPEADFDPLFVNVLAGRIALMSAEFVTQSNQKKADADALYKGALDAAKVANGFATGSENPYADVDGVAYSWVSSRY